MFKVFIIGGYGNFGSYIAKALNDDKNIELVISGRSVNKATQFCQNLKRAEPYQLDYKQNLNEALGDIRPDLVIHTSGPFQSQDYSVAQACLQHHCHYVDLADARNFVTNITDLNHSAKTKGLCLISGASSVPCLSAAVIDKYIKHFKLLTEIDYGIAAAQQTNRGLATASAILGYVGKPFKTQIEGSEKDIYGWQNIHYEHYPEIGKRLLGNCDIPDLSIFPDRYKDLKTLRFYAGTEVRFMHLGLWGLSWFVRWGLITDLTKLGRFLVKASHWFDWMGTNKSAFHMHMSGIDQGSRSKTKSFYLIARQGHGPYIPCMPAILIARKMAGGIYFQKGAYPCIGIITLKEYLDTLSEFDISHTMND